VAVAVARGHRKLLRLSIEWKQSDGLLAASRTLVIPDTVHDMHDGAIPESTQIGDTWLQANLGNFLAWAKKHRSLLLVTTDESDLDETNHILTVLSGDDHLFEPGTSDQYVSHFEVLRTVESMFDAGHAGASAFAFPFAFAGGRFLAAVPDHPRPSGCR
jgi:hypothetical protein